VSNQERPTSEKNQESTQRPTSGTGRSGTGADSAMKQLREWEQRRADDRDAPLSDKPATH
jgi:hypothetical protein